MIINSRNRTSNTTSADHTGTALAAVACAVFFLGLTVLTRSLPTAVVATAVLVAGWVTTLKMLAVPHHY
ncbi:hypothetical protein ABZ412_06585 [Nocardia sp. NPDC005746]|uniref:hypothetical protein n=1 Tax=unclassified Nocardia TaxID=2637762 RepID=UPI0033C957B5